MHCQNCGTQLSSDIRFCPNCGTAAPRDVSQPSPIDPTLAVSPYEPTSVDPTLAVFPYQPAPVDPAVAASPYQPSPPVPPTSYGPPPPPPSSNSPVPDPYAGYSPLGQQAPHGYSPMPAPIPPAPNVPNYLQAQPIPRLPVTPPRKSRTGLIIGITAVVLVVVICGLFALGASLMLKPTISNSTTTMQTSDTPTPYAEDTLTPTPTPTPIPITPSSTTPSGNPIDPTAASIVTDPQTASSIDQDTAAPINLTDTFQTNTNFYVTFKLNNNAFDFSQNVAYVSAKFYARSTYAFAGDPIRIDRVAPGGAFKVYYNTATPATAELYWCLQSDCSDAKLAQVVTFTITS